MRLLLILLVFLGTFMVSEVIGYLFHRFMHWSRAGVFNRRHLEHHLERYPPNDFTSKTYRKTKGVSTTVLFAPLFILLGLVMLYVLPWWLFLPYLLAVSLSAVANDYLHDVMHLEKSWLVDRQWFKKIRERHIIHHIDLRRNYGIYQFFTDKLFGSYKE